MFGKFLASEASARLAEEKIYEMVSEELRSGTRREGLWMKAIAKSEGDEDRATAMYVELRVQSIKDEQEIREAAERTEKEQRTQYSNELGPSSDIDADVAKLKQAKTLLFSLGYEVENYKSFITGRGYWKIRAPNGVRKEFIDVDQLLDYAESVREGK